LRRCRPTAIAPDSGTILALQALALHYVQRNKLSELLEPLCPRRPKGRMRAIEARYLDGAVARLDGISIDSKDWHVNSATLEN
jgi:hypothetical protein